MEKKMLAVITARGGSKRIPKKNVKEFCGRPIMAYSIQAALKSQLFDEVMVSTDSEEIAEIAKQYGARVPFLRSEKNSDDHATTAEVLLEVLSEYEKRGKIYEYFSCIYPTAPFITAKKLQQAYEVMERNHAIMAMPVVAFSYPPQRGYILNGEKIEMKWKENFNKRSQDLEKIYHDAGQFYMYQVEAFLRLQGQITENIVPVIIDEMQVQDIDNETDWKLAELKYQLLQE